MTSFKIFDTNQEINLEWPNSNLTPHLYHSYYPAMRPPVIGFGVWSQLSGSKLPCKNSIKSEGHKLVKTELPSYLVSLWILYTEDLTRGLWLQQWIGLYQQLFVLSNSFTKSEQKVATPFATVWSFKLILTQWFYLHYIQQIILKHKQFPCVMKNYQLTQSTQFNSKLHVTGTYIHNVHYKINFCIRFNRAGFMAIFAAVLLLMIGTASTLSQNLLEPCLSSDQSRGCECNNYFLC